MKSDLVFEYIEKIRQHFIIDIRAKMANGSIQQMQVVAQALGFQFKVGIRVSRGIELCFSAAVFHIDAINILHQLERFVLTDKLMQSSAKLIGDIVFSVRKRTSASKTRHNGTMRAPDTFGDFFSVNRTMPLLQWLSGLKYSDFQLRP